MVNNPINSSAYQGMPPVEKQAERGIPGGPLYEKQQVLGLVETDGNCLSPWTKKCIKDMRDKLCIDNDGAAELVRAAVIQGTYRNSEWCQGNKEHIWAACDAYVLKRFEWNRFAHKDLEIEYYVKFAINRSGKLLLLISCHNPENRV